MNRLATFIAIVTLMFGFFVILLFGLWATGTDLREYLGALTTLGIIIAGLGGFNYAAGRVTGAYTDVRKAQAEQGLQPTPLPLSGPTTMIQVGQSTKPEESIKAKDVSVQAAGDVTVKSDKKRNKNVRNSAS